MRLFLIILLCGMFGFHLSGIVANDRTDASVVRKTTWVKQFEDNWGVRSGYWGSVFVPMQSLRDLDNKMLKLTGHNFTIEQILSNRRGPWGSPSENDSFYGSEDSAKTERTSSGVTFQDYNSNYQSGGTSPQTDSPNESTPIPLSDLIVPQTRIR